MRSISKSTASRVTIISLLLVCMFVAGAEAYSCQDCGPGKIMSGFSGCLFQNSHSQKGLSSDHGDAGQVHHSANICPVCLSPSLVASHHVLLFTTSTSANPPNLPGV